MLTNNLYRIKLYPALVDDGQTLASVMLYVVKQLTDLALADGHQTMQLKWHVTALAPDEYGRGVEYWVCARALPLVYA